VTCAGLKAKGPDRASLRKRARIPPHAQPEQHMHGELPTGRQAGEVQSPAGRLGATLPQSHQRVQ
jgi:hypothetical protein